MTVWKPKKVQEYLTPNEALTIISAVSKDRDRLALRVLWETGARISEALSLVRANIDLEHNCLFLQNLKQHRRRHKDSVKLSPPLKRVYLSSNSTLCRDLVKYYDEEALSPNDWVFQGNVRTVGKEGQVSPAYFWQLLCNNPENTKDGKGRVGVSITQNILKPKKDPTHSDYRRKGAWPHLFRHGAAMDILAQTGRLDVVKEQLGHSTVMTTEIYAGITDEEIKNIMSRTDRK